MVLQNCQANPRPTCKSVRLDTIPQEIKELKRWIVWRYDRTEKGKWTKVPYCPWLGDADIRLIHAKSNDPTTWGHFEEAVQFVRDHPGHLNGIGFMLGEDFCGVDLDDCRDPDTGIVEPWATEIIRDIDSYSEVSPSNAGIKMLTRATKPGQECKKGDIEIYNRTRFFTITGDHLPETPATIQSREQEIHDLYHRLFAVEQVPKADKLDHEDVLGHPDLPPPSYRLKTAQKWIAIQPGAREGSGDKGADGYCFALAMKLLWGFALSKDEAENLLLAWGERTDQLDDMGQHYPWTYAEIRHKIMDAAGKSYQGTPGDQLRHWHADMEEEIDKYIKPAPDVYEQQNANPDRANRGKGTQGSNDTFGEKLKKWDQESRRLISFESWDETCAIAARQKEDWLIEHWAEFGSLVILSGLPFSGKSCIVAEIIACMARAVPFCGIPVQQVPFILLDLENKERILVKRLNNALQGDEGVIRKLYHRLNPSNVKRPLANEFIKACIDELKQQMASAEKGLLVIDTLRSAFAGTTAKETDNDDMRNLLYPLQALARGTGWCILVLHHNNKGSNHYSGGTVIAGACDYLWNWTSDKQTLAGTLEMDGGRDDHQYPLKFRYDMETQRNVFLGTATELKAADAKDCRDRELASWLSLLDTNPEQGRTREDVRKLALNCGLLDPTKHKDETQEKKVKERLQEAVNLKYAGSTGKGERGDPHRYYRTDLGGDQGARIQLTAV